MYKVKKKLNCNYFKHKKGFCELFTIYFQHLTVTEKIGLTLKKKISLCSDTFNHIMYLP